MAVARHIVIHGSGQTSPCLADGNDSIFLLLMTMPLPAAGGAIASRFRRNDFRDCSPGASCSLKYNRCVLRGCTQQATCSRRSTPVIVENTQPTRVLIGISHDTRITNFMRDADCLSRDMKNAIATQFVVIDSLVLNVVGCPCGSARDSGRAVASRWGRIFSH